MSDDQYDLFEPKLGKPRADTGDNVGRSVRQVRSFHRQVMEAVTKAGGNPRRLAGAGGTRSDGKQRTGRFNARGRGAKIVKTFPTDNGWKFDTSSGQRIRMRRVVVKARVVKLRGPQSRAGYAHLRYLQRDGVSREGEPGRLYNRDLEHADGNKFLDRGEGDRHQFRFIVAPEDGIEIGDLRTFTRKLMAQMEQDLDTQLDWVAVDHHNTGHPHSHVVVRGVTDDGKILNIAGDYIARGIRYRASEILTRELGLQSELEVQRQLDREVDQERLTRLDRELVQQAGEKLELDTRLSQEDGTFGDAQRYRLLKRLKKLERMGLATERETGQWTLDGKLEKTLRAMGERGDIIKTMHREMRAYGIDRGVGEFAIHHGADIPRWIPGRVIGKGLALNEMTDRVHVLVDGADGRVHYAEMPGANAEGVKIGDVVGLGKAVVETRETDRNIANYARECRGAYEPILDAMGAEDEGRLPNTGRKGYHDAHVRRLQSLEKLGMVERVSETMWKIPDDFLQKARDYDVKHNRQLTVARIAMLDLDALTHTHAATFLDQELIADNPRALRDSGFGRELHAALVRRQEWLVEQGLARKQDGRVIYRNDLMTTLAGREISEKGAQIAQERGGTFHTLKDGSHISGRYRGALELVSGRYALLEQRSREFALVPWRPDLERARNREIDGWVRGRDVQWNFGRHRDRGLGISM